MLRSREHDRRNARAHAPHSRASARGDCRARTARARGARPARAPPGSRATRRRHARGRVREDSRTAARRRGVAAAGPGVGWRAGAVGVLTMAAETEARFLHGHGVVRGLSVVVGGPRHAWGTLGVHTRRRRDFNGDDAHYLAAVANVIAGAVEADAAQRRLAFLAEASTVLSASLEYEATLKTLARLPVPQLAARASSAPGMY